MSDQLSLTEYSAKYGVSVSTLRRKIKRAQVNHTKENGKYFLLDIPYDENLRVSAPPQSWSNQVTNSRIIAPPQKATFSAKEENKGEGLSPLAEFNLPKETFIETPEYKSDLVGEIKKSYEMIFEEKEAQVMGLKSHIVDLQTLNKALEDEIQRLKDEKEKLLSFGINSSTMFSEY